MNWRQNWVFVTTEFGMRESNTTDVSVTMFLCYIIPVTSAQEPEDHSANQKLSNDYLRNSIPKKININIHN